MTPDANAGRKRGVLSSADREYLLAPDEYVGEKSRQSVLERKEAIRQRIHDSILDLALLFDHLPADIHADVFGATGMGGKLPDDLEELDESLPGALAFLYSAARAPYGHPQDGLMEEAIRRGEERQGPYTADVDVRIEPQRIDRLARKGVRNMGADAPVTNAQVRAMLEEELVEPDTVAAYLQGKNVDVPPAWRQEKEPED